MGERICWPSLVLKVREGGHKARDASSLQKLKEKKRQEMKIFPPNPSEKECSPADTLISIQ